MAAANGNMNHQAGIGFRRADDKPVVVRGLGSKGRNEVRDYTWDNIARGKDWYMEGKINIDDLITHTMPLERINDAFDLMHEGKSIRSVVVY